MMVEEFLRKHIHIILERALHEAEAPKAGDTGGGSTSAMGPTTQRLTGGRYSKKLGQTKSLADEDPNTLMKKLSIQRLSGQPSDAVFEMLNSSIGKTKEMLAVYAKPQSVNDGYGRTGAYIKVQGDSPIRDAALFLRLTARGARNAGFVGFNDKIFVERYEGGILVYVGIEPYSWNAKPRKVKKPPKNPPKKPAGERPKKPTEERPKKPTEKPSPAQ